MNCILTTLKLYSVLVIYVVTSLLESNHCNNKLKMTRFKYKENSIIKKEEQTFFKTDIFPNIKNSIEKI